MRIRGVRLQPAEHIVIAVAAVLGYLAFTWLAESALAGFGVSRDVAVVAVSAVVVAVIAAVLMRFGNRARLPVSPKTVALSACAGLSLASGSLLALAGVGVTGAVGAGAASACAVVAYGMLAPLAEELVYRRIALEHLSSAFDPRFALIVSALVFAAAHQQPAHMAVAFCAGIAFGLLYRASRSVVAPIVAHCTANLAALVPLAAPGHWLVPVFGVALLAAGIWVCSRVEAD